MVKLKQCVICNEIKNVKNYRIVNALNGYTSKTCRVCESENGINLLDDTRSSKGYIYLIFDSAFPSYIKIGYTPNIKRRLSDFNKSRPLDTCSYLYVSKKLKDIVKVEKYILSRIYRYTYSSNNRQEWFPIEYKEKILEEIKNAEAEDKGL